MGLVSVLQETTARSVVQERVKKGRLYVSRVTNDRRLAFLPCLIALMLLRSAAASPTHPVDYASFYSAFHARDTAAALSTGQRLYVRLALQADGGEPFYRMGSMLVSARQAADYMVRFHADPGRSDLTGVATSLWRTLPAAPQADADFGTDERGRFLGDYLRLYVGHQLERMVSAAERASSASDASAIATADHMVLLLGMLDAEAVTSQPAVAQAIGWLAMHGQSGRAIAQAMEHSRSLAAYVVGQGRLTTAPTDPGARKELVDLVGQLCKAQRIHEALALCDWARDFTHDPAYGGVLLMQQAVIAARDQKDPSLAIRLCDQAAATAGEAATVQLARHLAAVYCLNQGNFTEAIRRAESLAQDPATILTYRLKASSLAATAFLRQRELQEAVRVLTAALDDLAEPEPTEAADARQLLCQALLKMQRYDAATEQCKLLAARHPGHPAAKTATQAMEIFGRKDDAAESAK